MRLMSNAIPQNDLAIVQSVFDAWCRDRHIAGKDAKDEEKILVNKYLSGKHSQLDLLDALVEDSERRALQK